MDCAVKNLEKTSNIERKTIVSKLHNMQWLKNTSHSSNHGKMKATCKQIQDEDENNKREDKILLTENVNAYLIDKPEKDHTIDTCEKCLSNDTIPESNENTWNKDINTDINLFPSINRFVNQNDKQKDILSVVENIVTAKLEALCTDKEQNDQSNTLPLQNNAEDITQDAKCSNLSNSQVMNQDVEELDLIKHSDGNNNHSKFRTQGVLKINNIRKEKPICKVTDAKSYNTSMEVKDKDVQIKKAISVPKTSVKNRNNTTSIKYNEKVSNPSSDSKKSTPNSSKSSSDINKNGRLNRFNNRDTFTKNINCIRRQEFVKHNISKNGMEKETKNLTVKSSLMKTDIETQSNKTVDMTCHSKNISKDKVLQKQQQTVSKQFASNLKRQEYLKKSTSIVNHAVDKDKTFEKTEKVIHVSKNFELPLNESEKKNEKTVGEKDFQSDQKKDRNINLKKNTTFVTQYKNSTFSKPKSLLRNVEHERNLSYTCNNPRFDREHTGNTEHTVMKREYTPTNEFSKSNTKSKELHVNSLKNHVKAQNEISYAQSTNIHEIDTLSINDKKNIDSIKAETHLITNKEPVNLSISHVEQKPIMSEQYHEKSELKSKIDINQQNIEMNNKVDNEEINLSEHSSNLCSNKCTVESQTNVIHQHLLKLENIQHTDNVNQLGSNYITWNDNSSGNVMQKNATIVNSPHSTPNMHFNIQQTATEAKDQMKQMSPWGTNSNKFYNQHLSVGNAMPLSQIPNTFNTYEYNTQTLSDSNVPTIPALEITMNSNRDNSNLLYRYVPNIQQRSVMTPSNFPSHFITSDQTNRWNTSIQDSFHVEHPYNTMQPTMMHVNSGVSVSNDFNNTHMMNYFSHPVYTASPYMQTWSPQLQYPISVYYNSPCYTMIPSTTNESNNFNDISSMRDQEHKHIPYVQMNNYVKGTYRDMNNSTVQARNAVEQNIPMRSNQYYNKYKDNYRTVCSTAAQCVSPVSYPKPQQGINFMPATSTNQYSACYLPNQKVTSERHHQKAMNYAMRMSRDPKGQTHDLVIDNSSEDTPPIISPKEFINLSNKSDQFETHILKPEFKMRPNTGYRPSSRYTGGFRRNTTYKDFSKEYTAPISIGRGIYKTRRA